MVRTLEKIIQLIRLLLGITYALNTFNVSVGHMRDDFLNPMLQKPSSPVSIMTYKRDIKLYVTK